MEHWIAESQAVVAFAFDRDLPCPNCRYNVKNIPEPRCPECGMQLGLTLVVKGKRWMPPIIVPIAASAGLGVHLLLSGLLVARVVLTQYRPSSASEYGFFLLVLACAMLALLALFAVCVGRGRQLVDRATPRSRLILATSVFGVELLAAIFLIWLG